MKDILLIIGASGHGKVVADIALKMHKWKKIAFLDDDESIKVSMELDVIGKSVDVLTYIENSDIFVAVGNNTSRKIIMERIEVAGASMPVLIHPNAVIGKHVKLGIGTVVMAGVVINCCTEIGKGCIINTGSTLDHDNVLDNYVHVSPGVNIAGTVKVGKGSWIGIGSTVVNNVNITCDCVIGAGTLVVRDISIPGTYIGIPAKKIN